MKKRRKAKIRRRMRNRAAVTGITFVAILLAVLLCVQNHSLRTRVTENDDRIHRLQEEYEAEQQRTQEIEDLQEYMQSEEYIEQYAREKIGLVKENEIIFKEKE